MIGQTGWRIVKLVAYPALFVTMFVLFFMWSFPLDRFSPALEQKLSAALGRNVVIQDLSLSFFGDVVLEGVEIGAPAGKDAPNGSRPENGQKSGGESEESGGEGDKAADKAKNESATSHGYIIDEVSIDVGLWSALVGEFSVEIDAEALGGTLHIEYSGPPPWADDRPAKRAKRAAGEEAEDEPEETEATPIELVLETEGLALKRISDLRDAMPIPIAGTLDLSVELGSPTGLFADAEGRIAFSLRDLFLSRKGFEADLLGMKMAIPEIAIASVSSEMEVKEGQGEISRFEVKSKHVDFKVQGTVSCADPVLRSSFDIYVTFRLLEAYVRSSAALKTLVGSMDTFSRDMKRAHRTDGYYGFRYRGAIGQGRFVPSKQYTPPSHKKAEKSTPAKKSRSSKRSFSRRSMPQPPTAIQGGGVDPFGGQEMDSTPALERSRNRDASRFRPMRGEDGEMAYPMAASPEDNESTRFQAERGDRPEPPPAQEATEEEQVAPPEPEEPAAEPPEEQAEDNSQQEQQGDQPSEDQPPEDQPPEDQPPEDQPPEDQPPEDQPHPDTGEEQQ